MKKNKPDMKSSFIYKGRNIALNWFEVRDKAEIPDLPWQVVHLICDFNGRVPIVKLADGRKKLPGGHAEASETLEHTLRREIQEELNMEVIEWWPIGYQKLTDPDGKVDYQFRAYATLKKLGEFAGDVGGSVIGYDLVDINEVNALIGYGEVGGRMIEIAKDIERKKGVA